MGFSLWRRHGTCLSPTGSLGTRFHPCGATGSKQVWVSFFCSFIYCPFASIDSPMRPAEGEFPNASAGKSVVPTKARLYTWTMSVSITLLVDPHLFFQKPFVPSQKPGSDKSVVLEFCLWVFQALLLRLRKKKKKKSFGFWSPGCTESSPNLIWNTEAAHYPSFPRSHKPRLSQLPPRTDGWVTVQRKHR